MNMDIGIHNMTHTMIVAVILMNIVTIWLLFHGYYFNVIESIFQFFHLKENT
jgi:hypothetical protein